MAGRSGPDATGTDMISSIQTRMSMEARRSFGPGHRHSLSNGSAGDRQGLIRAYDEEEAAGFGLADLTDYAEDGTTPEGQTGPSNGSANGRFKKSSAQPKASIEQTTKPDDR